MTPQKLCNLLAAQLAALDRLGRPDRESATLLAAVGINPDVRAIGALAMTVCLLSVKIIVVV